MGQKRVQCGDFLPVNFLRLAQQPGFPFLGKAVYGQRLVFRFVCQSFVMLIWFDSVELLRGVFPLTGTSSD